MKLNDGMQEEYATYVENNSKDSYSKGVVDFAERWAALMESKLAEGQRLEDIADAASSEADTEGITGFMYGCAVGALSRYWAHGEQLRQWHNLKTQCRNEGERANKTPGAVLNPAVLIIGGDGPQ